MTRILTFLFIALAGSANGHDGAHPLTRLIVIEATEAGTQVLLQVPALLVYAHSAAQRTSPNAAIDAPFLETTFDQFGAKYELQAEAISKDPKGAARLVQAVVPLTVEGKAAQAISAQALALSPSGEFLVSDSVVEVVLLYPKASELTLSALASPPALPNSWYLETLIVDTRVTPNVVVERIGPLQSSIVVEAP